jgi:very-short-patch-repair endonuclease
LIIELDGGQHATNERDVVREQWLAAQHYRMLRFWNNDVMGNIDGVLEAIAIALDTEAAANSRNGEAPPHPDR